MIVAYSHYLEHIGETYTIGETEDDPLTVRKLEVAHAVVQSHLGFEFEDVYSEYVPPEWEEQFDIDGNLDGIVVTTPAVESDAPAPVKEAILKLTAYLLEFRELTVIDEGVKALPIGIDELLQPYKEWSF